MPARVVARYLNAGDIDDVDCCLAIGKSLQTTFSCVAQRLQTSKNGNFFLRYFQARFVQMLATLTTQYVRAIETRAFVVQA